MSHCPTGRRPRTKALLCVPLSFSLVIAGAQPGSQPDSPSASRLLLRWASSLQHLKNALQITARQSLHHPFDISWPAPCIFPVPSEAEHGVGYSHVSVFFHLSN